MNSSDKMTWFLIGWACSAILLLELVRELGLWNSFWYRLLRELGG